MQSCSTEETLMQNEPTIKTVSREHAIQFLQQNQLRIGNNKVTKISSLPNYGAILQEEISNSDQYLTVVPLIKTGKREQVRIVLLTVNDTLKSAVFTMYPDDEKQTKDFSGRIMITNLSGEFKNGFRVIDGIIVAQFVKKLKEKQLTRTANKITSEEKPVELIEVVIPPRKKSTIQINYIFDWSSAYDNSSPDSLIWDFEKSGGGGGGAAAEAEAEPVVEEMPPSCESFNFVKTAGLWQVALVKNVHFKVFLLNEKGVEILHWVDFPQPISFGTPTNIQMGNIDITPGLAANASARALQKSMQDVIDKYGSSRTSDLTLRLYFQERLKHNYPLYIPGGRVNFNATENIVATEYKTNPWTAGNCN